MGKSLIIPGADFSANAIEQREIWYSDEGISYPDLLTQNFISDRYFSTQLIIDSVQGKNVNAIRIAKNNTSGSIKISVVSSIVDGTPISIIDYTELQIPHIFQPTIFRFDKSLTISQNQGLFITVLSPTSMDSGSNNCLLFGTGANIEPYSNFYEDNDDNIYKRNSCYLFGFDFGYLS